jgi:hypothetical protein
MTKFREFDNVKVYIISVVKVWTGCWSQLVHDRVFANTLMKVWEFVVFKTGVGGIKFVGFPDPKLMECSCSYT